MRAECSECLSLADPVVAGIQLFRDNPTPRMVSPLNVMFMVPHKGPD